MLSDIIKSVQSHVSDRITSPLMGSIIVSWVLWNYRFIVVLFSDATILRTFKLIDTVIFPDKLTMVLRGIVLPLVTAAFYLFVFPYPSKWVYAFARRRQLELNAERQKIEKETLLSKEESREIRSEIAAREVEHQVLLESKEAEITGLREINKKLTLEIQESVDPKGKLPSSTGFTDSQLEIIYAINKAGGKISEKSLLKDGGEMTVRTEHDLDILKSGDILERDFDHIDLGEYVYTFTPKGRAMIVNLATPQEHDQLSNGYRLSGE